jgi:hypothetical protein
VLRAQDPFEDGQQGGVLVAGGGRVPRHPGPVGEVAAGVQGVGVLGTVVLAVPVRADDQREQVPGRRVAARVRALLKELEIS